MQISHIYREINERFIGGPRQTLYEAWTEQREKNLFSDNPQESYASASKLLRERWEKSRLDIIEAGNHPKKVSDFLIGMGKIFGVPSQKIILQYISEAIQFCPPELSGFEKTLQLIAFKQMEAFFEEIGRQKQKYCFSQIETLFQEDMHAFYQKDHDHPVVRELAEYYQERFQDGTNR